MHGIYLLFPSGEQFFVLYTVFQEKLDTMHVEVIFQ